MARRSALRRSTVEALARDFGISAADVEQELVAAGVEGVRTAGDVLRVLADLAERSGAEPPQLSRRERRALLGYKSEYQLRKTAAARRAREAGFPEPTARQALGHRPPGELGLRELYRQRAWGATWFTRGSEGGGEIVSRDVARTDARRAGRYMALTQQLLKGRISPSEFKRKVQKMPKIDGIRPLSDPAVVLALVAAERAARRRGEGKVTFESGRTAIRRARELLGLPPEPPARPTRRRRRT